MILLLTKSILFLIILGYDPLSVSLNSIALFLINERSIRGGCCSGLGTRSFITCLRC